MLNPLQLRNNFPILTTQIDNQNLVYLDNAATSQKPQQVIDAISDYYTHSNANVHRGVHTLSDKATLLLEDSRKNIADFFGADQEELIIVRNATQAINGVAYGWADHVLKKGDVILTTLMEHHANIVPWQEVCKRIGTELKFVRVTKEGLLDLIDFQKKLENPKVRLVTLVHISNTLGTVNPVDQVVKLVANKNKQGKGSEVRVLVDGAQSAPHIKINFHSLGVDFFVFSGHKMLAPMGVGGLLVRKELLESGEMQPWLFGGGMINTVSTTGTELSTDLAERFTPGTPDVASTVGLAVACGYLQQLGMDQVEAHDRHLVDYTYQQLSKLKNITIIGPKPENRISSVAFLHKTVHAHDVAQILNSMGVAVRSGHHCCMPLHTEFGWQATVRVSFQVYNTEQDIDRLVKGLHKVSQVFGE